LRVSTAHTLAAITNDVLSMLGEPTMGALVWELDQQGISIKSKDFDIIKVDRGLRQIFGNAADLFMEQIYKEFKARLSEYGMNVEEIVMADKESISVAWKITRLLALKASR
jgi:hypothetical protein